MKRREFLVLLGGVAVVRPFPVHAQPQTTIPHIGYLWLGVDDEDGSTKRGLRQGLRDLGYVEGRDIIVDYRYADGHEERLAALVGELVDAKVDIILSPGSVVTSAVKKSTTAIPVVSTTGDPVGSGFIQSLARPGSNITGLSLSVGPEIAEKFLELLHEIVPGVFRIANILNPSNPPNLAEAEVMQKAAEGLGIVLMSHEVRSPSDLPIAFDAIATERSHAMIVAGDPLLVSHRRSIVEFAAAHQLPAVYGERDFVDAGGLAAYGVNIFEVWRRAASYVDKILKGARPADLPVERPTVFELVLNLKTAKALGLAIPQIIVARADQVIE
jgi:putative tryptophan/tyrosine transport system substrate-binding protein